MSIAEVYCKLYQCPVNTNFATNGILHSVISFEAIKAHSVVVFPPAPSPNTPPQGQNPGLLYASVKPLVPAPLQTPPTIYPITPTVLPF